MYKLKYQVAYTHPKETINISIDINMMNSCKLNQDYNHDSNPHGELILCALSLIG
jgi:hypothetical protein